MAMMLKNKMYTIGSRFFQKRHFHFDLHVPFQWSVGKAVESAFILPESTYKVENFRKIKTPNPSSIGYMEVMAVPKRKVSPHKRGIRNGPKALKPTPVIIRCKACGRVKLPHFYCCSGIREPGVNTS